MNVEEIKKILVVGAGSMGEGIVQNFAQSGFHVVLLDIKGRPECSLYESLDRCCSQIETNLNLMKEYNLISEDISSIMSRIDYQHKGNMIGIETILDDIDYVVESVPENLELKRELFAKLEEGLREDVIISSNTSSLTVNDLAEGMKNPERFVGLHYFYPSHIIPLVEIHGGDHTSEDAINLSKALMDSAGKKAIVVKKVLPGLIVNRIQAAYNREIAYLLDEGVATAEDLDMAAIASYGFRLSCLGPLEIHDLNGLDVVMKAGGRVRSTLYNGTESAPSLVKRVKAGELGVKTGKGWHDYNGQSREQVLNRSNRRMLKVLQTFNGLN